MTSTGESLAPRHEGTLETREGVVHMVGGGTGEPLLYLHGIGAEPGRWNAVHEALSREKDLAALARFGWVPFLSDPKLERRLYRVTARTLVIAAEHDAVLPRVHCERYAAAIAGARLLVLPGTGHAMDAEAPGAFTTAVIEFLGAGSSPGNGATGR